MSRLADALRDPIALAPNRVPRFYRGGRLLDEFRGATGATDGERPEDWIGSATRTWTPPGAPRAQSGASTVELMGEQIELDELLRREPEALAGEAIVRRAGPTLGVLVKLLDAAERLPVHAHPSREHAADLLGSRFGKTEAWFVLGTRDPAGAPVWAGFARDVGGDELRGWIERQETDALLGALSQYRVAAGDALLIPAGTPHAIGAGTFLLELQEPTDFSLVAETRGFPIDARDASLGLGWDRAIEMFETRAASDFRQAAEDAAPDVTRLFGLGADRFFRALRQRVGAGAEARPPFEPAYAVGVVLAGRGDVTGATRQLPLARGITFALPASAVSGARVSATAELDVVWCLGPDPASLDAL